MQMKSTLGNDVFTEAERMQDVKDALLVVVGFASQYTVYPNIHKEFCLTIEFFLAVC